MLQAGRPPQLKVDDSDERGHDRGGFSKDQQRRALASGGWRHNSIGLRSTVTRSGAKTLQGQFPSLACRGLLQERKIRFTCRNGAPNVERPTKQTPQSAMPVEADHGPSAVLTVRRDGLSSAFGSQSLSRSWWHGFTGETSSPQWLLTQMGRVPGE